MGLAYALKRAKKPENGQLQGINFGDLRLKSNVFKYITGI
jgi:hypothetical protein